MSGEAAGSLNWFVCPVCDGLTVTLNQNVGSTPNTIQCRANGKIGDCEGWAGSAYYPQVPLPDGRLFSLWAWYRPDSGTPVPDMPTLAYLQNGGLLLRPIVLTDKLRGKLAKARPPATGKLIRFVPSRDVPDPKAVYPRGPGLIRPIR